FIYSIKKLKNITEREIDLKMRKNKFEVLSKKELLNTNGGGFKVIVTDAGHYPREWGKQLGKWIGSKIK
ncbi:hypothetical protein, partial [Bacillus cereus]|uniref:hypothetical protein n=1 Tax=Bacillus cereus TaxID=1396 RepID=UPI000778373A